MNDFHSLYYLVYLLPGARACPRFSDSSAKFKSGVVLISRVSRGERSQQEISQANVSNYKIGA